MAHRSKHVHRLLLLIVMMLSNISLGSSLAGEGSSSRSSSWFRRMFFSPAAAAATTSTTPTTTDPEPNEDGFTILDEKLMYSGWRTIVRRKIRMRNGRVVDFDLVGVKSGGSGVMVFTWNTQTKTATLVREYMPASHRMMYGLAAGLVETDKHGADVETAARNELEEEAHLTGGTWIPLSKCPSAMEKYSLTNADAYLVLDPVQKENPKPLDDEEDIEIVEGVTIPEIMNRITNGEMNLVSGWGCLLAIDKLRELGEYP